MYGIIGLGHTHLLYLYVWDNRARAYSFIVIYMYGIIGLGHTHLLLSICMG